jgi:hypothetical protein
VLHTGSGGEEGHIKHKSDVVGSADAVPTLAMESMTSSGRLMLLWR